MSSGFLGTIPDELRIEAVDRESAAGQRLEIHSDDGEHRRIAVVAENGAGEFLPRQVLLDENGLVVVLEEKLRLAGELDAIPAQIAVGDPLG